MKKGHLWLPSDSQMTIHDDCLMMVWQLPSTAWWLLVTVNEAVWQLTELQDNCLIIKPNDCQTTTWWWLATTKWLIDPDKVATITDLWGSIKMQNETHHMRHKNRKLPWWKLVWRCHRRTFWRLELRVNNETDKFKVWAEARHWFDFIPKGCHDLTR